MTWLIWRGILLMGLIMCWGLLGCTESQDSSGNAPDDTNTPGTQMVGLERVATGLAEPLLVTHAGDDRLFILERVGRIRIVQADVLLETPFLDIADLISLGGERGLLGVAFHPAYSTPGEPGAGLLWVNYTNVNGATVIARYTVASDDPNQADPASARILLTIAQPLSNHNGGHLQFGPAEGLEGQRYLYIGLGDGGGGGDPDDHAQREDSLLGKMLRLAPSTETDPAPPFYAIPGDNPRLDAPPPLDTVWAKGLRNPFRFSFDLTLGDLYIADVGQDQFEEVHRTAAGTPGGLNYGWRLMEGLACFLPPEDCATGMLEVPIATYAHENGRCAIIGGYVYRGMQVPDLQGIYLYADFCSGEVFGLDDLASNMPTSTVLLVHDANPLSFGEDRQGEVYLTDSAGDVFRLTTR